MSGRRPPPFSAFTTPEFWDDPHISAKMLKAHLNPDTDAASRRHDLIDRSVEWIVSTFALSPRSRVLDLGCGPGLYAGRIASQALPVVGIDVSRRSIAYARSAWAGRIPPAEFRLANYLEEDLGEPYDVALLAYEDFCALSPLQRSRLLHKVAGALAAGCAFVMDVTSQARFDAIHDSVRREDNLMNGFWAARPYEGIHETWTYPELCLVLDRFTIIEAGRARQFWNWMHCLTPNEVSSELEAAGFASTSLFGDIAGAPYDPTSPTFAVVASTPTEEPCVESP